MHVPLLILRESKHDTGGKRYLKIFKSFRSMQACLAYEHDRGRCNCYGDEDVEEDEKEEREGKEEREEKEDD